ncbi:hypothetical protein M885DRAFT_585046 [Pelagophyceae sp. CCMP2097]|nr:hypothetical protein M885DRAFT_585046 [Pelagophyceae sp. CCMP2097]
MHMKVSQLLLCLCASADALVAPKRLAAQPARTDRRRSTVVAATFNQWGVNVQRSRRVARIFGAVAIVPGAYLATSFATMPELYKYPLVELSKLWAVKFSQPTLTALTLYKAVGAAAVFGGVAANGAFGESGARYGAFVLTALSAFWLLSKQMLEQDFKFQIVLTGLLYLSCKKEAYQLDDDDDED